MPVTRNLTILLTDIKGFTDKTSHQTRAAIQELLDEHRSIVLPLLEGRGGKLIKTIGDAFLMTFESPTDAVLAGVAVQEALRKRNTGRAEGDRIEVRIAINSGEVNLSEGDIFGEPVNITARIEGVAEAGEVFFTESVYLSMNKTEVPSSLVDKYHMKGIAEEVKVYKVRRETQVGSGDVPSPRPPSSHAEPGPKAWVAQPPAAAAAMPAAVAAAGRRPKLKHRAAALAIDAVLCSIIAGVLAGGRTKTVHIRSHRNRTSRTSSGSVTTTPAGLVVKGDDGSEVTLGAKGLHVKADDGTEVNVDASGVKVAEKGKPAKPADKDVSVRVGLGGGDVKEKDTSDDDDDPVRVETVEKSGKDKVFPFVWLLMNALTLVVWGATPGKKVLGLKVVPFAGGGPLDPKIAVLRSVFTLVSGSVLGLGFLWAVWEKDGRGWHDLLAGTRVVEQ